MTADLSVSLAADVDDFTHTTGIPTDFGLEQNFPNPFNPQTVIGFDLPRRSHVYLSVYNVLGEEVDHLVDDDLPAGKYELVWSSQTRNGDPLPSGVYFYRLIADEITLTRKMLLLK
jgi:hypothetical protein